MFGVSATEPVYPGAGYGAFDAGGTGGLLLARAPGDEKSPIHWQRLRHE